MSVLAQTSKGFRKTGAGAEPCVRVLLHTACYYVPGLGEPIRFGFRPLEDDGTQFRLKMSKDAAKEIVAHLSQYIARLEDRGL